MPSYIVRYLNVIADSPEDALSYVECGYSDKVEAVSEKGTLYRFNEFWEAHLFNTNCSALINCGHSAHGTQIVCHYICPDCNAEYSSTQPGGSADHQCPKRTDSH